ncbi:MAG: PAS domain S-box protein [Kiritimatiellia bacterium]
MKPPGTPADVRSGSNPAPERADAQLRLQAHLLESVRESVVASDLEGRILYWGPGAEQMYGYKAGEVLGQPYRKFAGAVDPPDEAAFRRDVLARGHWEGEHVQQRRSGETFWTASRISVFTDEEGRPAGFIGIDRDVTERKRRESRLAKINECFLSQGGDFTANVDRFVALAGELLDSTCALYNRLESGLLCSLGQWHVPPDYDPRDRPEGHVCYDLIRQNPAAALVLRHLQDSAYARTDPNVARYGLQTYVGQVVKCGGAPVGSLCAVFQNDFEPTGDDLKLLGIIAAAIGVEEERREAQGRLGEHERQQRIFLDATSDLVFLKDERFRYVISNRANNAFLGKSEAEVLGHTDFELMPRAAAESCQKSDQAALRQGTGIVSEETVGDKTYQALKFPVPLANGRIGVGSYIRDVSESRQAEETLRQSQEKFAKAFQTSPYAILITRAEDGRFLDVNDAFVALFGHAKAAVLATSTLGLNLWADPDDRAEVVAALRRGESIADREYRFRTGDGRILVGQFSAQPIQIAGADCILSSINDLTARKQAEEKLRESEARLSTALDMARAGYWEYDVDADVFTFNDHFYRVYKTTAAQAGGYRMSAAEYARRFCSPEDAAVVAREVAAAIAAEEPGFSRQFEHRIRCGDGSVGHVAVRFFVVKDAAGRTVKTYGVNQNVTERKQAEEKLRASLDRFQDITANLPGAIYQLQTGRTGALEVPYMSSGCEALFERPVAEMDFTGLLFDRMHVGDRALFEHSLAAAARVPERWSLEFRVSTPAGQTKWLRASANPRTLPGGAILWTGVLLDITRLKQAEDARRESEERFHLLVKNASDVIAVIDAAGILKYVSPAEEPVSGFRPEELIGKSIREVIHPDDLAQTLQAFQATVAQPEKTHRLECRHVHKNRGWFPVEIVGQSFLAEPAVKGVIVSVRDVSERRKAEEEMSRQLAELRRWYAATLGREGRIAELKREVNALAKRLGQPPPYASAEEPAP